MTIRIELDTRTVKDWNELDYVQLIGPLALPQGVLEGNQLAYVPDASVDAFGLGEDTPSYAVSNCAVPAQASILARGGFSSNPACELERPACRQ